MTRSELLDFYRGKHVLVTGNTGFKGSWLSEVLLIAGCNVTGYALDPPTSPSLFELLGLSDRMESEIGDIRDQEHLERVFRTVRPDFVFHLAAQPIVRDGYSMPVYTYETNVMGTVNILECARRCDWPVSIVNVTTDKVYCNREWEWGYREDDVLDGFDPYSNSKSCSELVTRTYARSFFADGKISCATARAGNVIGGGDYSPFRIIPDCVRAASRHADIVVRNPDSVRPYQHVLEPLYAYLLIGKSISLNRCHPYSYNVGPDDCGCVDTRHIVEIFCREWGNDIAWRAEDAGGPHESNLLKLDNARIKRELGWAPTWNIGEAVSRTVAWEKQRLAGGDMRAFTDGQILDFFGWMI